MNFNVLDYKQKLKEPHTRIAAEDSLEFAIKRAPIEVALELKKLRTPEVVLLLEYQNLRRSGFDMESKRINGVDYDCDLLAFHARWDHAKKYWPELAEKYSMAAYPLTRVAA